MTERQGTPLFTYHNDTQTTQTLIIEPWAHEYAIFPGERVEFRGSEGRDTPFVIGNYFELQQTSHHLVFYWNGTGEILLSLQDGQTMMPFEKRSLSSS